MIKKKHVDMTKLPKYDIRRVIIEDMLQNRVEKYETAEKAKTAFEKTEGERRREAPKIQAPRSPEPPITCELHLRERVRQLRRRATPHQDCALRTRR